MFISNSRYISPTTMLTMTIVMMSKKIVISHINSHNKYISYTSTNKWSSSNINQLHNMIKIHPKLGIVSQCMDGQISPIMTTQLVGHTRGSIPKNIQNYSESYQWSKTLVASIPKNTSFFKPQVAMFKIFQNST